MPIKSEFKSGIKRGFKCAPRRDVRRLMRASVHCRDRGLQSASEANGKAGTLERAVPGGTFSVIEGVFERIDKIELVERIDSFGSFDSIDSIENPACLLRLCASALIFS